MCECGGSEKLFLPLYALRALSTLFLQNTPHIDVLILVLYQSLCVFATFVEKYLNASLY